jgi:anti-anti-sigma factor
MTTTTVRHHTGPTSLAHDARGGAHPTRFPTRSQQWGGRVAVRHGRLTLQLAGELDLATARGLEALLGDLERDRRPLLVDMRKVAFADSHGLAPLIESARWRRAQRLPALTLHRAGEPVTGVLAILGVTALHPSRPSRPSRLLPGRRGPDRRAAV